MLSASTSHKTPGFTLVEVIAAFLVLAIVSAVVAVHVMTTDTDANNAAMLNRIKIHLGYVRNASMNSDMTWWIDFNPGSYTINRKDAQGNSVPTLIAGEKSPAITFPDGFSGPDTDVYFDGWGRPADSSGNPTGTRTLVFSGGTITINSTGYIE